MFREIDFQAMPLFKLKESEQEQVLNNLERIEAPTKHQVGEGKCLYCLAWQCNHGMRLFQCDNEGSVVLMGLSRAGQYINLTWYQGDPAEVTVMSELMSPAASVA